MDFIIWVLFLYEELVVAVLDCKPKLNDIEELVHELNKSNGLYKFVRIMRGKLQAASSGTLILVPYLLERAISQQPEQSTQATSLYNQTMSMLFIINHMFPWRQTNLLLAVATIFADVELFAWLFKYFPLHQLAGHNIWVLLICGILCYFSGSVSHFIYQDQDCTSSCLSAPVSCVSTDSICKSPLPLNVVSGDIKKRNYVKGAKSPHLFESPRRSPRLLIVSENYLCSWCTLALNLAFLCLFPIHVP